jgi:hypothetical protein
MRKNFKGGFLTFVGLILISLSSLRCTDSNSTALKVKKGSHIILIGNNLGSRMMDFGHFETEMQDFM